MVRRSRTCLSILVAGVGLTTALAWAVVLTAPPAAGTPPPRADLIIVLADDPSRDAYGARLVEQGFAPRAVSTLHQPHCLDRAGTRPTCASGVRNTVDEALHARRVLAAGVGQVTVVTSRHHALRASLVFKIVFAGSGTEVTLVSPPDSPASEPELAHEVLSLVPSAGAALVGRLSPSLYEWIARVLST